MYIRETVHPETNDRILVYQTSLHTLAPRPEKRGIPGFRARHQKMKAEWSEKWNSAKEEEWGDEDWGEEGWDEDGWDEGGDWEEAW